MKRFISLLIVIAMVISLFSVNAFAASTHTHDGVAFTAWSDTTSLPTAEGNYYLTVDVKLGSAWETPSSEVNLCLNGHMITYKGYSRTSRAITVNTDSSLIIYDCSGAGIIENTGNDDYCIYSNGSLTVNGGTISGEDSIYSRYSTLTVNGGIISGNGYGILSDYGTLIVNDGTISGGYSGIEVFQGTLAVVNGGTISGNRGNGIWNRSGPMTVNDGFISGNDAGIDNSGTLTVYAGTISGDKYGIENSYGGTATVNGGTISGGINGIYSIYKLSLSGDVKISGNEADIYLQSGYINVTGELKNTKPYTVTVAVHENGGSLSSDNYYVIKDVEFTNTEPDNLAYNDLTKFISSVGYSIIKNDRGQLEFIDYSVRPPYKPEPLPDPELSENLCKEFNHPVKRFLTSDGYCGFNNGIDTPSWIAYYTACYIPNVKNDYPLELDESGWYIQMVPRDVFEKWAKVFFANVDVEELRQLSHYSKYDVVTYIPETQMYKLSWPAVGDDVPYWSIAGYVDKGNGQYDVYYYHLGDYAYYSLEDLYRYEIYSNITGIFTYVSSYNGETIYCPLKQIDMITINYDGEYCQYVSHVFDVGKLPDGIITCDKKISSSYLVDLLNMTEEDAYAQMVEWFGENNVGWYDVNYPDGAEEHGIYEMRALLGTVFTAPNNVGGAAQALSVNGKIAMVTRSGSINNDVPEVIEGWESQITYDELMELVENTGYKTERIESDISENVGIEGAKNIAYIFYVDDIVLSYIVTSYDGTFDGSNVAMLQVLTKWYVDMIIDSTDDYIPGDLNGDGVVNITDAIELLKYVAKLDNNVVNKAGADVDGNGTVNINDAIYLLKMIAKLI